MILFFPQPPAHAQNNVMTTAMCNMEGCQIEVKIIPSREFDLELARRRIMNVELPGLPQYFTDEERSIRMSYLQPESAQMVRGVKRQPST